MKKIIVTLVVLVSAVVWNHSLKDQEANRVKGAILESHTQQHLEKESKNGNSEHAKIDLSKENKIEQINKEKDTLKESRKKRMKKFTKSKKQKTKRRKEIEVSDNPFEANFDHLPDYTFHKGDSDFKEELKDPGSL